MWFAVLVKKVVKSANELTNLKMQNMLDVD